MKRWLAMGALTAALCVGGLAGTLALFTDSETAQNQFRAGTLTIESVRDQGEPNGGGPMFYVSDPTGIFPTGEWAPGDTHWRNLHVFHTGTIHAVLTELQTAHVSGDLDLAPWLHVTLETLDPWSPGDYVPLFSGTLQELIDAPLALSYDWGDPLEFWAGDMMEFAFTVHMPLSAPNAVQGKTIQVDFTLHAVQMTP